MKKINLHTHTIYCDGKNTAEEMIVSAIEKGFDVLGFSGHSYMSYDESYCMSLSDTRKYRSEIPRLAEKYKSDITVLCGIEQDYYSYAPALGYDYIIGSLHAFYNSKVDDYLCVDADAGMLAKFIDEIYGGDAYALAEDYFKAETFVVEQTGCDIIGHFDLLTKFNEHLHAFDESHPRYVAAVDNALSHLLAKNAIFEINTGAISKGYRSKPYPSESILRKINAGGGKIIISSDSHAADTLDYAFEDALVLAAACGFDSIMTIGDDLRFTEVPL